MYNSIPFLSERYNIGLMLNIDWFQPFKHRTYSIGVMYFVVMNLPRHLRFKRENVVLAGLIPGPSEPKGSINSYLTPHVSELLSLWSGVTFTLPNNSTRVIRCALLCVACDLPAGRKVCVFFCYVANLGCSRCYCNFGTGVFGKQNYSGFNRDTWVYRSNLKHREDVQLTLQCTSKSRCQQKESELGCRYSCLLQLPYFDPVKMMIVDPMHNLYIGTTKTILHAVWIKRGILDKSSLVTIDERISSLNVPLNVRFSRLHPLITNSASSFTAEQWMVWVNYYSLYCLHELLPVHHFECWRHFVLASRLLSKRQLNSHEASLADALLLQFCRLFQHLYGNNHCSSGFVYVPAKKYTLATFSDLQLNVLSEVYCILYPELSHHFTGGQVILGLCTVGPSLICTCTPHKESHTQAIHQVLCCQNGKQIQKLADLFDMHSSNSDI